LPEGEFVGFWLRDLRQVQVVGRQEVHRLSVGKKPWRGPIAKRGLKGFFWKGRMMRWEKVLKSLSVNGTGSIWFATVDWKHP
jgi:hypothetical protein